MQFVFLANTDSCSHAGIAWGSGAHCRRALQGKGHVNKGSGAGGVGPLQARDAALLVRHQTVGQGMR